LRRTRDLVERSPQTWVSSNVSLDGERFGASAGVVPATTFHVADLTVGVFGLLDPETPSLNPAAADLTVSDPIEVGTKTARDLRTAGVDVVIALSHLGQGDEELAVTADVDVVLGGHVHSERQERVAETILTRPGVNGHVVFELLFDGDTWTVNRRPVAEGPVEESVLDRLQARSDEAGLHDVVATVEDPIERSERTVFRGESRIGNFVADAYRWAADTDVALQNSGGIREGEPLEGHVTVGDLISVVPFEEPVTVAELNGADLWNLFEGAHGDALAFGEPHWWHAHVSGAELHWDEGAKELQNVFIGDVPLDPEATYTLATTDYLFYTSTEFTALDATDRIRRLDVQHQVLVDYASERGIDPTIEGRIQR
jgi:2',3'-cyclic-nucleotide 2'-phosphodiesterase (5'-nucleotidase family)